MKSLFAIKFLRLIGTVLALTATARAEESKDIWWNPAWTERAKVTLDSGGDAAGLTDPAGSASVLVRLSDGNFNFNSASADGSDIRFVATDGKTLLPHQIEKYDNILNEAYVWVKLPEVKPAAKESFYIYFANTDPAMVAASKPAGAFDSDYALVYHFSELGAAPADATANANTAETVGTTSEGAIIGSGLRLLGAAPLVIPAKPSLQWQAGQTFTFSTWIKPSALQGNAVIVSRSEGSNSFRLLLDQGIPVVEIAGTRSPNGPPLAVSTWTHLALVADGQSLQLFLNGAPYAKLAAALPAMDSSLLLGAASGFIGELDEFTLSKTARSAGWVKLAAVNQGTSDAAQRTLVLGQPEGGHAKEQSKVMEHLSLFGDIAGNMMFDGWIAIGVCGLMIAVGWTVAIRKFIYLNSIEKGTKMA